MSASFYYTEVESPVGVITLTSSGEAITGLYTSKNRHYARPENGIADNEPFREAVKQLREYFAGERRHFELKLAPQGTEFQKKVWKALCSIGFGQVKSYGAMAVALKQPTASRAVGMANGRNPIGIIIPCHRVIGADGSLTGYAGGLDVKEWLLKHEGAI